MASSAWCRRHHPGLRERGLTSVALVSLGYRSAQDFNAALPKSRLAREEVFTFL